MPFRVRNPATTGFTSYGSPFVGRVRSTAQISVNIATLTDFEVDAKGYLKPGVPLTRAGILVGVAPAFCFGVTIEAIKLTEGNGALRTGIFEVTVATNADVNQDAMEDILGRALTADELAGFDRAGSKITLQT